MLVHTFCHLPGIGPKTEHRLWDKGVDSWQAFLARRECTPASGKRQAWPKLIEESCGQLERSNAAFFAHRLPGNQLWRLFKEFRDRCAYLDIETTGLGNYGDHVTTIALFDGREIRSYVYGINLDDFPRAVGDYPLLITYNGACFDLPFLERQFGMSFPQAHIDLRYLLKGLGFRGGLKQCEKQLNMSRPGLEDLDGYAAVLLWRLYKEQRNEKALETLLAYNVQDTINLQILMNEAFNRKLNQTPFDPENRLPDVNNARNLYTADPRIVERITQQTKWRKSYWTH